MDCTYYTEVIFFSEGTPVTIVSDQFNASYTDQVSLPDDGSGNGLKMASGDKVTLGSLFTSVNLQFSIQIVFTGLIEDGLVIELKKDSTSMTFSKSSDAMTSGGDLFTGHTDSSATWVLSISMIDTNIKSDTDKDRFVDFQLLKVGDSLTNHG